MTLHSWQHAFGFDGFNRVFIIPHLIVNAPNVAWLAVHQDGRAWVARRIEPREALHRALGCLLDVDNHIFAIVLLFVYLVLAAQYESFLLPFAVLLSLPVGIFGSFALLQLMGLSNDVYAQIGMIMLVGLLGKNAVLIVEVAVQKQRQGSTILESAIAGAKLRFRPILMTSFAFIAGLIPLVAASGAGAIGNRTIGGSALGGMLIGTLCGVLLIPGLYFLFASISEKNPIVEDEDENPLTEEIRQ